jgi:CRISPR-associated protein Csy1
MSPPEIIEFLEERKQAYLKKNLKSSMSEGQQQQVTETAAEKFNHKTWIPDAAKRAGQLSFTTHPVTLSNPSARKNKNGYATAVIAECSQNNDGYLRSGNIDVELDALGNAAALDVYKFLTIEVAGKTVLQHIKQQTEIAQQLLNACGNYNDLREQFLQIIASTDEQITSEKIKQVYVEAEGDYHLLSVLNPSGIMQNIKQNINHRRFSEQAKTAREAKRNNKYDENGFQDFYDLTEIGYGGTKPQNISVINSTNGGNFFLLPSLPPTLSNYKITCPVNDFFKETIKYKYFTETFIELHKLYKLDTNNIKIRRKIKSYYLDIFYAIINTAKRLRKFLVANSFKSIENLPKLQRIWLIKDEEYLQLRIDNKNWQAVIIKAISQFIQDGYKSSNKDSFPLSQAELNNTISTLEPHKEQLL